MTFQVVLQLFWDRLKMPIKKVFYPVFQHLPFGQSDTWRLDRSQSYFCNKSWKVSGTLWRDNLRVVFPKLVFPPQKWQSLMGGADPQTAPFIILFPSVLNLFFFRVPKTFFSNLLGIWFSCLVIKCKGKTVLKTSCWLWNFSVRTTSQQFCSLLKIDPFYLVHQLYFFTSKTCPSIYPFFVSIRVDIPCPIWKTKSSVWQEQISF